MKKRTVRTMILGAAAGVACIIRPAQPMENVPCAIYQGEVVITVFYLIWFVAQRAYICDHALYDWRFDTCFKAKLYSFLELTKASILYTTAYFLCSCAVSLAISADNISLILKPFSLINFIITVPINLAVFDLALVNLNYLSKRTFSLFIEVGVMAVGFSLYYSIRFVPHIFIFYYSCYAEPMFPLWQMVLCYFIWSGVALMIGFIPQKDILRKEQL